MLSFWERDAWFNHSDFCIIGAGIVGLSAAYRLKQLFPKARILVLERGTLPDGASTKNAGFACFGSLTEIAADLKNHSADEVLALIRRRVSGLNLLRSLVSDHEMDYQKFGGYEVFKEEDEPSFKEAMAILPEMNKLLMSDFAEEPVYSLQSEQLRSFGFKGFNQMLLNRAEAQIDTGKMMKTLLHRIRQQGIEVLMGVEVLEVQEQVGKVSIRTPFTELEAAHVLLTTNAFAAQLAPELEVKPGRAQVLITQPVENLPFKGTFHYQEGYFYFRNVGNRVLLGGGRNLDFEGETTYTHALTPVIQNALERLLNEHILPGKTAVVEQRWAGTLGLGVQKSPITKMLGSRVACSVRMGGMGVALGSRAGFDGAELFI
jgi:gamma-glutamylputrescine oxidase